MKNSLFSWVLKALNTCRIFNTPIMVKNYKTTLLFSCISMSLFYFSACKKEAILPENTTDFYLNGTTKIDSADFKETATTIKVVLNATTFFVFENETDLLSWANKEERDVKLMAFKNDIPTLRINSK